MDNEPVLDQGEIESVNKAFRIIEQLREIDGGGVSEIAENLGWAKSTVYSHLQTLERNEYVVKEGDRYVLGFRFVDLGEYVKHRKEVYSLVETKIESLAAETGERVQLVITEHGEGVYARIATGDRAVSTGSHLGRRRRMLHATAAGKTILATLPEFAVQRIIDQKGLPKLTQNTITNENELWSELDTVRNRNYAFNNEEHIIGLCAVAAPITIPEEDVYGAISIAGPAYRMRGERLEEELPDLILGVKNEIELDLQYR